MRVRAGAAGRGALLVGDHVDFAAAGRGADGVWLGAMSGDARAGDDGRGAGAGALDNLQLLEVVVELREGLGKGIRQGTRQRRRFGAARAPLAIVLALASIPAGVFRVHL